ncbi:MAG: hypothetical protein ABEI13_01670, partial [Candidatus Paceibacteria bacterium]
MALVLTFLGLVYLERFLESNSRTNEEQRRYLEQIWFIPVSFLWAGAGFLLLSDAPGNTRIFGPAAILTAPLLYDFVGGVYRSKDEIFKLSLIFILISSLAFVGVIHPRSTVDEFNRPSKSAIDESEEAALQFIGRIPKSLHVGVYSPVHRYYWYTNTPVNEGYSKRSDYNFLHNEKVVIRNVIYSNGEEIIAPAFNSSR